MNEIFISSRVASQKESSHIQPRPRCWKAGALTNVLAQFPGLYAKLCSLMSLAKEGYGLHQSLSEFVRVCQWCQA